MRAILVASIAVVILGFSGCGTTIPTRFVYAAGQSSTSVSAFKQNASGSLSSLSTGAFDTGAVPSVIVLHPSRKFLFALHPQTKDIDVLTRDTTTGLLTVPGTTVSTSAIPIAGMTNSSGGVLFVLTANALSAYTVDATTGALTLVTQPQPPSVPPNAVAFTLALNTNFLYVASGAPGNVKGFATASTGTLTMLPNAPSFPAAADLSAIVSDPTGRLIYVADKANNAVTGFTLQTATGALVKITGTSPDGTFPTGTNPVALAIDPKSSFLFVANQGSHNISAFTIGSSSGTLNPVSGSPFDAGTDPVFLTIDATAKFLYVANRSGNRITVLDIDRNGRLSPAAGSPLLLNIAPTWIATSN